MSYIHQYFGRNPEELSYQDIVHFFSSEKEESDKIEFKSYYSANERENATEKENGVIRTICALLNSNGGIIIWGAPVGQIITGRTEKVFVGNLSAVKQRIEKDYFINRVTDSITPSPNAIYFVRLENGDEYVYVIEVGKSEYAPHQFRNTYYMRIDGQSKPAPHHYIEALFKRITYPKLKGFIRPDKLFRNQKFIFLFITPVMFNLSKLQNEHNLYFRIVVSNGIFSNSRGNTSAKHKYGMNGHELKIYNAMDTIYYNEPYNESELLEFEPNELEKANGEVRVLMYFGGKDSPLLFSSYKFRIDLNNFQNINLNDLIIEKNENQYSYEYSDSLELTEEQRINTILGR